MEELLRLRRGKEFQVVKATPVTGQEIWSQYDSRSRRNIDGNRARTNFLSECEI